MKRRLLVLWDPPNPLVPIGPVVGALRREADVREVTFREVSHQTMPNGTFEWSRLTRGEPPEAVLWVEGGPLPRDVEALSCPKACWLVNLHEEPSLLEKLGPRFDLRFVTHLASTGSETCRWLPLASSGQPPSVPSMGVSIVLEDPKPPSHARFEWTLRQTLSDSPVPDIPLSFCLGTGGQAHRMICDCLDSGAAVVVDPESDLRGLAHAGEHLEVFPSLDEMVPFTRRLLGDRERLRRLSEGGPRIVSHLHTPDLRARQIMDALWPRVTVLSSERSRPKVSILAPCYRYLRRFRRCLESLARQDMPPGSIEVVVADPGSPDGLSDHLKEFARGPQPLRIVHLRLDPRYHRNRGLSINRAFDASSGEVILAIDGDILFPPHLVRFLCERILEAPRHVYGVRRVFLDHETTESVLSGALDPVQKLPELSLKDGDGEEKAFVGVLGYCQAVTRGAFARARYPEELDMVNQSDIVFVERLERYAGVQPRFLEDEKVLHLWHPRNWMGTRESL